MSFAVQVSLQVVCCGVLVLGGGVLLLIGWRSSRGELPLNQYFGVRTPATLCSEEAFETGNRVAAPAMIASGAVGVLSGVTLPMLPTLFSVVLIAVIGFVGVFALMTAGGVLGNRAAEAVPAPATTGGCGGCAGGCCCTAGN